MSHIMHNPPTNRAKFVTAAAFFLLMVSVVAAQDPGPRLPSDDPSTTTKKTPPDVTKKDDKLAKEDVEGLLTYLRTISRAYKEYHLNDTVVPYSFAIPLDCLNEASQKKLKKGIKEEMARDGLLLDGDPELKQVHLALSADAKKFDTAHCFFVCKVGGKDFPTAKGKVVKLPIQLDFTEASSDAFAKLLLGKLVGKTGIPLNPPKVVVDITRHTVVDEPTPAPK